MSDDREYAGKKVFISYGRDQDNPSGGYHREGEWAARLIQIYLEDKLPGVNVWLDKRELGPASSFCNEIRDAIFDCHAFIAIISPHSVRPHSICENEIAAAHEYKKLAIPILAKTADVPLLLKKFNYIDLNHDDFAGKFPRGVEARELNIGDLPETARHRFIEALDKCVDVVRKAFDGEGFYAPLNPFTKENRKFDLPFDKLGDSVPRESVFREALRIFDLGRQRVDVVGKAGVGKSYFAAQLPAYWDDRGEVRVLGYHRCRLAEHETHLAQTFVFKLASQIHANHTPYKQLVEANPELYELFSKETDAFKLMRIGIGGALKDCPIWSEKTPAVVVVDALDEIRAEQNEITVRDVLEFWGEMMPAWLRLIVTRQPKGSNEDLTAAGIVSLAKDLEGASNELKAFIEKSCKQPKIKDWLINQGGGVDFDKAVAVILARVNMNFRYAATLFADLRSQSVPRMSLADLPSDLNKYYEYRFEKVFSSPESASWQETKPLLAAMVAARSDRSPQEIGKTAQLAVEHRSQLKDKTCKLLHPLAAYAEVNDDKAYFCHASVPRWLASTNSDWRIPEIEGHLLYAKEAVNWFFAADDPCQNKYMLEHGVTHCAIAMEARPTLAKDTVAIAAWMNESQGDSDPDAALLQLSRRLPLINRFLSARLEGLRVAGENEALKDVNGDDLCEIIITGCDDIPSLRPPLRILLEHRLDSWRANCDKILTSDQLLTRHAASLALADIVRQKDKIRTRRRSADAEGNHDYLGEIRRLFESLSKDDRHLRETGQYALRFIFVRADARTKHEKLFADFWQRLARSADYSDQLTLWEMLVDIAADESYDESIRDLIRDESFWQPIWPYFENDIAECDALEARKLGRPLTSDASRFAYERHDWILEQLRELENRFAKKDLLLKPLKSYWKTTQCIEELDFVEAQFGDSEQDVLDYLTVFVVHPSWHVAEAATSVLARMIDFDERLRRIIDAWAESKHWQARYAAEDAAFNSRESSGEVGRDQFSRIIKKLYNDPNMEVQYVCAEGLFLAIDATEKYLKHPKSDQQTPAKIVDAFHDQIRYWLRTAEDCTLLDELFEFFQKAMTSPEWFYAEKRVTFEKLLIEPISEYLKVPDEPGCDTWWKWDFDTWVRAMDRWRRKNSPTTP